MNMWEGGPKSLLVNLGEYMVADEVFQTLIDENVDLQDDEQDIAINDQHTQLNVVVNPDGSWKIVGVNNIPLDFTKILKKTDD